MSTTRPHPARLPASRPSPASGRGGKVYAVKECFLTLQGEGVQSGSRAVFLRFAGCNLWSGREQDRASAQCTLLRYRLRRDRRRRRRQVHERRSARGACRGAVGRGQDAAAGGHHRAASRCSSSTRDSSRRSMRAAFRVAVETNGTLPAGRGHRLAVRQPQGRDRSRPAIGQ